MKAKPVTPTALKVPEWLLRESEGYVSGSTTRHAVLLAMLALGAKALREDASLLDGAIEQTRKPRKVPDVASEIPPTVVTLDIPPGMLEAMDASVAEDKARMEEAWKDGAKDYEFADSPSPVSPPSASPTSPSSDNGGPVDLDEDFFEGLDI